MKKIISLIISTFVASICLAQTVQFSNATDVYYGATFHTSSVSGSCPSTVLTTFYMDVPNNHNYSGTPVDENGNNISSVSDITGISLRALTSPGQGTGATYPIAFCVSSTPSIFGSADISGEIDQNGNTPAELIWFINGAFNTISIIIQ